MSDIPQSVAQHWDLMYTLLASIIVIGLGELRYAIHRYVKKQETIMEEHQKCQLEVIQMCVELEQTSKDILEIKKDRKEMWQRKFFPHSHYPNQEGGGVKIPLIVIKEDS